MPLNYNDIKNVGNVKIKTKVQAALTLKNNRKTMALPSPLKT